MIGGDRAQFGGQTRATRRPKLVGVQLERIAQRARLFEDAPRLLHGEGGALAEDIAEARVGGKRGQHPLADEVHIGGAVAGMLAVLRRQGVRAEKCRHDGRQIRRGGQRAHHGQAARLALGIEPVAGFALDGGGTVGGERLQAAAPQGEQRLLGGGAGGAHGAEDAASLPRQLFVGDARVAQLELFGAVAREDEVGVRIDEAGQNGAPTGIVAPLWRQRLDGNRPREISLRPHPDDAPSVGGERALGMTPSGPPP